MDSGDDRLVVGFEPQTFSAPQRMLLCDKQVRLGQLGFGQNGSS